MHQAQELFEPGEYLQGAGRPGYFSILARPGGRMRQQSHELRLLPEVVSAADPDIDTWITQAIFARANRRAVSLRDVGLLFVDLDTYRSEAMAGKTPEELTTRLLLFCGQEGIPAPSIVLYSGRGLQAKWLLSEALGPVSLHEWNQTQLALVRLLEPFSSDMNAKDISRVLRLDRTVNTKSGERCRVVHVTGIEACPARYDFEELRALLVGQDQAEAPREERRRSVDRPPLAMVAPELTLRRLNWYRLYDLRDLWRRRGGVPVGHRETTLFWELTFLLHAEPGKVSDLWKEAEVLAAEIDPGGSFYRRSDLSTLYRKAKEARAGQVVEFGGRTYPPLYTPRNTTLMEVFRITPDEERELRTIISQVEKVRRRREKRRAEGVRPRSEYEELALSSTRPWEALEISRATWYRIRGRDLPPS